MGHLGGSQSVRPLPMYTPFLPTPFKREASEMLPPHLSCKTFLSLLRCAGVAQRVVIVNELRVLLSLLLSCGFESNASDGMWYRYGGVWLKGNRAGELSLSDCDSPCSALWFVAAIGVYTAFPRSHFPWLKRDCLFPCY